MRKTRPGRKKYLELWVIANYYQYQIYEVDSGVECWLEAVPITRGVTRIANDKNVLREILETDAGEINRFYQKVR